jgi:hypothetical protein
VHKSSAAAQQVTGFPLDEFSIQKAKREHVRWLALCWLDAHRPEKTVDLALLALVQTVYAHATIQELHRELDYLADRGLLAVVEESGRWQLKLTYQGVDVVEYTTPCPAGIGRPPR